VKKLYRLFRRKGIYYVEDAQGKQQSLRTRDLVEAQALCAARNEAARMPSLNMAIGHAYLSASDPLMPTRTWAVAMTAVQETGRPSSRVRKARAFRAACFDRIRAKPIAATIGADFIAVIEAGGRSANLFARALHNYALKAGWLVRPVLAAKHWPVLSNSPRRGISEAEHKVLLSKERDAEWCLYLRFLWESGCSQSDGAMMTSQSVDWEAGVLHFRRQKLQENSEPVCLVIGARLQSLLDDLPQVGPLFPRLRLMTAENRAGHFQRLCAAAAVKGITLHCYRYAWAERAARAGYPMRWAKAALGHKSTAVHLAYAKKAGPTCPSLEEFEDRITQLPNADQSKKDRVPESLS